MKFVVIPVVSLLALVVVIFFAYSAFIGKVYNDTYQAVPENDVSAPVVGTFDGRPIYKKTVDGKECYFMKEVTYGPHVNYSISCLP